MQGFIRTEPTHCQPTDVRASLEFDRVAFVARALVIVTIMSRFGVSCFMIFMRDHVVTEVDASRKAKVTSICRDKKV